MNNNEIEIGNNDVKIGNNGLIELECCGFCQDCCFRQVQGTGLVPLPA